MASPPRKSARKAPSLRRPKADASRAVEARVQNPTRLSLLRSLELLDSPEEPAFDHLTRLAATLLDADVTLVSLVDAGRQFFKSQCGLDEPWASRRETPLSHSFCQHVVATAAPLVIRDARRHPVLKHNQAIPDLGVVGYAGVPLRTVDGQVLGTLCAIDHEPRRWDRRDLRLLERLSALAMAIIELREARRRAAAGRAQLDDILARVSDGFVALDRSWHYTYVNAQAAGLFGRKPEELIGRHIWTEFPEGVGQPFHQAYETAMAEQRPVNFEDHYAPWNRWFENRVYPSPDGLTIFFHEITERKRAEAALRELDERLRLAIEATGTGLWDWDLQTRKVRFSRQWQEQIGYADHEIGDDLEEWRGRVHPDDIGPAMANVERFVAAPERPYESRFRLRHRDGSYRWILARGTMIRDAHGTPIHMVGLHVDVTDTIAAQHALADAERRFGTLMEQLPGLVYRCRNDAHWTAEFMSVGALELTGYPASDFTEHKRHLVDSIHPDDRQRVWSEVQAAIGWAQSFQVHYRITTAAGTLKFVWEQGVGVRDAAGEVVALEGYIADVTESRVAEQQLRQAFETHRTLAAGLERAREAERTRVARELHDELGQALTGLKMDLSWLRSRLPDDAAFRERADAMARLLDETVAFGRRLAGELRPGVLDDLGLAPALRWLAREFAQRSGLAVEANTPDAVELEPERATAVFRIVQEALTNVARHAGATRVGLRLTVDAGALEVEVRDDGRGLTSGSEPGTLGVIGMRERAEAWGGVLSLGPAPGGGTRLAMRMPLTAAEAAS